VDRNGINGVKREFSGFVGYGQIKQLIIRIEYILLKGLLLYYNNYYCDLNVL